MKKWSPEELQRIYTIARNVSWRMRLDAYEDQAIAAILNTLEQAVAEIEDLVVNGKLSQWQADRSEALLVELDALTAAARLRLTEDIANVASHAGEWAVGAHNSITSFDGLVADFNTVSLSAAQFGQFFVLMPLGGKLLSEWVDSAFDSTVKQAIRKELNAGMLRGEGYRKLVKRILGESMVPLKNEAITLARTYVQSANVAAQTAVYEANRGVVKGYEWCAALEPGYQSGRGTCLRCAALDGQKWDMDEERPDCPLHPRCRCELLPVTKSWRELGLDIDEIEEVARPWTMRPDENIDAGGRRAITEHGFHNGDYGSWYAKQDSEFQADLAGKKRAELLASGDVKFHDLVDRKTGRLLRLDELTGEKAKPGNLAAKSPMEAERILRDVGLSDKDKAALKAYTGRDMQQLNKALRDKSGVSTTSRKLARDLSTALSKLPMFVGTVTRRS